MRFLSLPLRPPGPLRRRVPMFLLVMALAVALSPAPGGLSAGVRLLPAGAGEAPPATGWPDDGGEGGLGSVDGGDGAGAGGGTGPVDGGDGASSGDEAGDGGGGADTGDGRGAEDSGDIDGTFAELDGGPVWPLVGRPSVLRGWDPPATPYGRGHRGVDLAARPGDAVLATATGRVSFAGRVAGRGVLVVELAGSGAPPLRTTYEPVRALVDKGDKLVAGQPVGVLEPGPFHCVPGCLHWGLRRAEVYLNPLLLLPPALLRRGPSRLLPVFGVPEPEGPAEPGEEPRPEGAAAPGAAGLSRVRRAGSSRRRCPR
ncbi:peptidoglycan DD-metalloendopeptidase family protein [Streptomyces sp. NPDC056454]|uniref:peptidoglycan DD-metalloendopeptidase family protein n=1 Tax=Streptomyces sp. NPDC056454 TaxID=3345823 RepID=UPI00367CB921